MGQTPLSLSCLCINNERAFHSFTAESKQNALLMLVRLVELTGQSHSPPCLYLSRHFCLLILLWEFLLCGWKMKVSFHYLQLFLNTWCRWCIVNLLPACLSVCFGLTSGIRSERERLSDVSWWMDVRNIYGISSSPLTDGSPPLQQTCSRIQENVRRLIGSCGVNELGVI